MRRGFSLIEVMVALCILMVSVLAFFRMHQAGVRAGSYAECLTRATALASSEMMLLGSLPYAAPELEQAWHQDPGNPITDGGMRFFRFWILRENSGGKDATVYVAWSDKGRVPARNFASQEEIDAVPCPKIAVSELLFSLQR